MSNPIFAEDSNMIHLAPILSKINEELDDNADINDYLMVFLIAIMAENGYRVSCLYNVNNGMIRSVYGNITCFSSWSKEMTCIPKDWKNQENKIYEIEFLLYKRKEVGCKLIGIPVGDWLVLDLLARGASSRCKTRCMSVHVAKYVNMHPKELGRYWHLKELALKFKNELLAPLNGEIQMEIGIASPSLQGLPEELKVLIADMLDKKSRTNLEKTCKDFSGESAESKRIRGAVKDSTKKVQNSVLSL